MPERSAAIRGKITHIFKHRFVIETKSGAILADVTPHGLDEVTLKVGDTVSVAGEMKPSELKVERFTRNGKTVHIEHGHHHHHHHHPDADPKIALAAAREYGFEPVGEARRKPKHFEILGRKGGKLTELHIELDGHLRKTKDPDRHKWT